MGPSHITDVKFIFLLPYVPCHSKYLDGCKKAIESQNYPQSQVEVIEKRDDFKMGQVYCLNLILSNIFTQWPDLQYTYINFHGVDDYLLPDALGCVNRTIVAKGYPEWLYGGHIREHKGILHGCNPKPFDLKKLKWKNYIAGGAVFVRADMYKERRFRDLAFKQGADWDMWLRLGKKEKPRVINDYIYVENLDTSVIRLKPGKITTKIFNRIKYPIWRIQRCLKDLI